MRDVPGWIGSFFHTLKDGYLYSDPMSGLLITFGTYFRVILLNAGVFIAWAAYNSLMFGRRVRRRNTDAVVVEEIAENFHVTTEQVLDWQRASRLVINYAVDARIEHISTG